MDIKKTIFVIIFLLLISIAVIADPIAEEEVSIAQVPAGFPVGFCLVTNGNTQYVGYYDSDHRMTIAMRQIGSTSWIRTTLGETVGWDSHNYVTLQIDSAGYIHVSGNMHNVSLRYYRSNNPNDIGSFQQINSMIGINETSVTYPNFLQGTDNNLYFYYRDGASGNGAWFFNRYDTGSRTWLRLYGGPLFGNTGDVNAYFTGPKLGPDGRFHIGFLWRDSADAATCHDMSYIRTRGSSLDSWETASGQALSLPVTVNNTNTIIDPVPVAGGLINMGYNIGFDSQSRAIITYHKYDNSGNSQIYNARFENSSWVRYQASSWNYRWDFGGLGAIPCDVEGGPVKLIQSSLLQDFRHVAYGQGHWVLNSSSLQPESTGSSPFGWPAYLNTIQHSNLPNGQVNWKLDAGDGSSTNAAYFLRWETLPPNRDQQPSVIPPDGTLKLYRISYDDSPDITPVPTAIPGPFPNIYSVSSQPEAEHPASNILDGDMGAESRWSAQAYPQWVIIDYGSTKQFTTFSVWTYEGRAYQYSMEVSNDASSGYSMVVDRRSNTQSQQPITDTFNSISGRYMRLTVTGALDYTGDWISILEISAEPQAEVTPAPFNAQVVMDTLVLVNDYWIGGHSDPGSNTWDRATYFEGNITLYNEGRIQRYYDYAVTWGNNHSWNLSGGTSTRNADNQTCGQTYIDLYRYSGNLSWISNIKTSIDNMVGSSQSNDWWWIDAIQMAGPVFAKLGNEYNNTAYYDKMYDMYNHTKRIEGGSGLYNTSDHLWWRDANYNPPYAEPNGEDCYWSRGNGWVFAGLARMLSELSELDPHRNEYLQDFQDMADALRVVQRSDGFWNASLHDPNNYGGKETSGTSFFTYGMAWGINNGILDSGTYRPVVERAWTGLATDAVHPNGFLGYVQAAGAQPSDNYPFTYNDTTDFGVGAFLLAGSEIYSMLAGTTTPTPTPQPSDKGDVNSDGSVNIIDALLIAQYYVGLPVSINISRGDVNCDSAGNIIDALLIAQFYVGLIQDLNC